MKEMVLEKQQPWAQPWWRASEGNIWVLVYIVAIHILAVTGLILFPLPGWPVLAVALTAAALGGLGTSVCYHRSLAHRSVRLNPLVEQILIFFAIFNGSGAPTTWAANHRQHHAKADTPDDVSSPRYGGFWWAHLRWLYQWPGSDFHRWCPDMDRMRYRVWWRLQIGIVALSLFSGLIFGWKGFFWMGAIRLVYSLHMQCFVNSLLHRRLGDTYAEGEDSSRNLWWLGPLQFTAWGENWHRNHHSDAKSARFGWRWWQVDIGWYVICLLRVLGLASDVKNRVRAAH
jgi:stearoyl-CoA desaturase (delta-9 desaturase)